ncbi:MAG: alpha/beta fold hydrolase [bacterium]|nr:alpha/beta fold hydrolase [bacterium]
MQELLNCIELEPPGTADASVIWMHGLGADASDFPPVVPMLGLPADHGVRFVFPNAPRIPVTVNGGMVMPAWYDILALDFDRRVDEEGVRRSAAQVTALIERERERGVTANRIVVAGFSQGGAIAYHVGLRHPERLAGILALSTYIACDGDLQNERSTENADIPIFHGHGTMDPMVVLGMGVAAREKLTGLGYEIEWHEYPMQHQVCAEEIEDAGRFLASVLG